MQESSSEGQSSLGHDLRQSEHDFNETYRDWIAEHNAHHEAHGLWCDGLVVWPGLG